MLICACKHHGDRVDITCPRAARNGCLWAVWYGFGEPNYGPLQETSLTSEHWNFHSVTAQLLEVSFPTQQGTVTLILQLLLKTYRYRVTWLGVMCLLTNHKTPNSFIVFPGLCLVRGLTFHPTPLAGSAHLPDAQNTHKLELDNKTILANWWAGSQRPISGQSKQVTVGLGICQLRECHGEY